MKIKFFIFLFLIPTSICFSQNKDTLFLYYAINESDLSSENKLIINNLLSLNNIFSIEIIAYTDFLGSSTYNQSLSEKRATNIYNYLINNNFSNDKIISYKGLGVFPKSHLFQNNNDTIVGVASHRRAEIRYSKAEESPIEENDFEIGQEIVLENIIFEGGTSIFKLQSQYALNQLVKTMQQFPKLEIEIQGHICCKYNGEDGYDMINKNNFLSLNRAKAVYDYLIKEGIDANRMTYNGYGSSKKRFPQEKTEEEENLNRRVEIKILNK